MSNPESTVTRAAGPKTALSLAAILAAIAAVIGVTVWWIITNPADAANVFLTIIIVIVAIILVIALIWVALAAVIAPIYLAKGEKIQTDMSYDLDDVKSVKESSGGDKKE